MAGLKNFTPEGEESGSWNDYAASIDVSNPVSLEEAKQAAYELSISGNEGLTSAIANSLSIKELEQMGGKVLSADELNAKYPMPEPFRQPRNELSAKFIYDTYIENQERRRKLEGAPRGAWDRVKLFGSEIGYNLLNDPVTNILSSATLGAASVGVKVGFAGTRLAQTLASQSLTGVAARLTGEAVIEGGLTAATRPFREAQATMMGDPLQSTLYEDVAMNALGSAVIGGLAEGGGSVLRRLVGRRQTLPTDPLSTLVDARTKANGLVASSPKALEQAVALSLDALDKGKLPNVAALSDLVARQVATSSSGLSSDFRYNFQKLGELVPPGRKLYVATDGKVNASSGLGLFSGIELTDAPFVANSKASPALDDVSGKILEYSPSELKLFDADKSFSNALELEDLLRPVVNQMDEAGLRPTKVSEALEYASRNSPELLEQVESRLRESGFDGVTYDGAISSTLKDAPSHNVVSVFDESKLGSASQYLSDPNLRPDVPDSAFVDELYMRSSDPVDSMDIDDPVRAQKIFDESQSIRMDLKQDVATSLKFTEQKIEELDIMAEQGFLSQTDLAEVKAIKDLKSAADLEVEMARAASVCVRTNG